MSWCTLMFDILDQTRATDFAIREAIEFYLARRAKRAKESA